MSLAPGDLLREVRLLREEVAYLRSRVDRQEEALREIQDLSGFEVVTEEPAPRTSQPTPLPVVLAASSGASSGVAEESAWTERIIVAKDIGVPPCGLRGAHHPFGQEQDPPQEHHLRVGPGQGRDRFQSSSCFPFLAVEQTRPGQV